MANVTPRSDALFKVKQTSNQLRVWKMVGNLFEDSSLKINPDICEVNIFYLGSERVEDLWIAFIVLTHHKNPSNRNNNAKACIKYHDDEALAKMTGNCQASQEQKF